MNWKPITPTEQNGQVRVCGWAWEDHLQVARAFHDGAHWFAIGPNTDGTISRGGTAIRMTEAPTHWLASQ
jgi:hypothetical protein